MPVEEVSSVEEPRECVKVCPDAGNSVLRTAGAEVCDSVDHVLPSFDLLAQGKGGVPNVLVGGLLYPRPEGCDLLLCMAADRACRHTDRGGGKPVARCRMTVSPCQGFCQAGRPHRAGRGDPRLGQDCCLNTPVRPGDGRSWDAAPGEAQLPGDPLGEFNACGASGNHSLDSAIRSFLTVCRRSPSYSTESAKASSAAAQRKAGGRVPMPRVTATGSCPRRASALAQPELACGAMTATAIVPRRKVVGAAIAAQAEVIGLPFRRVGG
ncbi:hypothetical protein SAMN05428941_2358 [Streptomyces sp. 2114.2]|nr:hypothetical protein BX268_2363 [Streptomyces sp. 2221.1]SDT29182.1 hypothetical protein SAMN05428941_2358 [Streptomyces sp. 2114.2]